MASFRVHGEVMEDEAGWKGRPKGKIVLYYKAGLGSCPHRALTSLKEKHFSSSTPLQCDKG